MCGLLLCKGVLVLLHLWSTTVEFWWRVLLVCSGGGRTPKVGVLQPHDHFYQKLATVCARMQMHTIVHDHFFQQLAMVVCARMHTIVYDHFYQQLVMVVCARMHSARYFVHDHFYQQLAKVHVRSYTACSANVRVCTHTSTLIHTFIHSVRVSY